MKDSPITNRVARIGEESSALKDLVYQQVKTEQFTAAPMSIEGMAHQETIFTGKVESAEEVHIEVIAGYTVHSFHHAVITGRINFENSHSDDPIEVTRLKIDKVILRDKKIAQATVQEKNSGSKSTEDSYSIAV